MPDCAVYVGRGSKWGNPFRIGDPYFVVDLQAYRKGLPLGDAEWRRFTAQDVVSCYRRWLTEQVGTSGYSLMYEAEVDLAGKDLACWCPLDQPCHADVLLQIANH